MTDTIADSALISGANRGLGLEWVRQLSTRVEHLFATCRRPDAADKLASLSDAHSDTVEVFAIDVADPESIRNAASRVRNAPGDLDLLVNNAGIAGGASRDTLSTAEQERMTDVLRVNAVGPHLMTQAFSDQLRSAEEATVVNVTSQLGSIARTSGGGWHSYKASKAALNMCTRLQAAALKEDGVIVVAMHPGWVRTDMGGSHARLSTEESVSGMLDVVDGLTIEDSGDFLAYDGQELPW